MIHGFIDDDEEGASLEPPAGIGVDEEGVGGGGAVLVVVVCAGVVIVPVEGLPVTGDDECDELGNGIDTDRVLVKLPRLLPTAPGLALLPLTELEEFISGSVIQIKNQ